MFTTAKCPTVRPILRRNASGDIVSQMQALLNDRLAQLDTVSSFPQQVPVTGFFGEQTEINVKYLQCLAFLSIDGVVGAQTWAYLCEGSASMPVLRRNATGDLVRRVQQALQDEKLYTSAIDGQFGARTEAAVRAFQSAQKLTVDGIIGARTWTQLSRGEYGKRCFVTVIQK